MDIFEKILTFIGKALGFFFMFPISALLTLSYLLSVLIPLGLAFMLGGIMFVLPEDMCGAPVGAYVVVYTVLGLIELVLLGISLLWIICVCYKIWETWQWDMEQ